MKRSEIEICINAYVNSHARYSILQELEKMLNLVVKSKTVYLIRTCMIEIIMWVKENKMRNLCTIIVNKIKWLIFRKKAELPKKITSLLHIYKTCVAVENTPGPPQEDVVGKWGLRITQTEWCYQKLAQEWASILITLVQTRFP